MVESSLRPFVPSAERIADLEIEHQGQAAELVEASADFDIKNDEDLGRCSDLVNKIHAIFEKIEEQRDGYTRPLFEGQREFNAHFKIVTGPLVSCEKRLREMMTAFQRHQRLQVEKAAAEQRKVEAKAAREAKAAGDPPPPPKPPPQTVPVSGALGGKAEYRESWKYRLEDKTSVPLKYLMVDEQAVNAAIRGPNGLREIPGLEIYDAGSMKTR